jgi:hypothetical protein
MHTGGAAAAGRQVVDFATGLGQGTYVCDARHAEYVPLPVSKAHPTFTVEGGLGSCGVVVDGTKGHGWMTTGAANAKSGYFRAAQVDALYLEVNDDHWTSGDRIELHLGRPAGFMQCFDELTAPYTLTITADGVVSGARAPVTVERPVSGPDVRIFRVGLGDSLSGSGLTVVQRDDDDAGATRIITSAVGKELGDTLYTDAACAMGTNGLMLVPTFE